MKTSISDIAKYWGITIIEPGEILNQLIFINMKENKMGKITIEEIQDNALTKIKELKSQIKILEATLRLDDIYCSTVRIEQLQNEIDELKNQRETLRDTIQSLKDRRNAQAILIDDLRHEIKHLQKQNEELEEEIKSLKLELEQYKNLAMQQVKEIDKLQKEKPAVVWRNCKTEPPEGDALFKNYIIRIIDTDNPYGHRIGMYNIYGREWCDSLPNSFHKYLHWYEWTEIPE